MIIPIKIMDLSNIRERELKYLELLLKQNKWDNAYIKTFKNKIFLCSDIEILINKKIKGELKNE